MKNFVVLPGSINSSDKAGEKEQDERKQRQNRGLWEKPQKQLKEKKLTTDKEKF